MGRAGRKDDKLLGVKGFFFPPTSPSQWGVGRMKYFLFPFKPFLAHVLDSLWLCYILHYELLLVLWLCDKNERGPIMGSYSLTGTRLHGESVSKEAAASGRDHGKRMFTKISSPYGFGFEDPVVWFWRCSEASEAVSSFSLVTVKELGIK